MEQRIINNNIVVLYQEDISTSVSTDIIEAQIQTIFADKNPVPVVNKFPGLQVFIIPQCQMTLFIEGNKLTVTDQNISSPNSRETSKLLTFTRSVFDLINKPCTSYGFNFIYEVEGDSSTLNSKLKNLFFKRNLNNSLPENSSLSFITPSIGYINNGIKVTVKFENIIEGPSSDIANIMKVSTNCHFNENSLPVITDLISRYQEEMSNLTSFISRTLT